MKREESMLRSLILSENKSGLSAVVATLIIILLVLVAVGIIWVVIRNVLQSGAETIELDQKCRDISFKSPAVQKGVPGVYVVTLERNSAGGLLAGAKLNFFNATHNSGVIEFGEAINALESKTKTVDTSSGGGATLIGANRFDVTPYFEDDLGSEQVCSDTISYSLGELGASLIGGGEGGGGICGDGFVDSGETCDFGDTIPGDGCSALCQTEVAPTSCDGVWNATDVIDGNECDGTPLPSKCQAICTCEAGFGPDGVGGCLLDAPLYIGTTGDVFTSANPFQFISVDLPSPAVDSLVGTFINFTGIADSCRTVNYHAEVPPSSGVYYVRMSDSVAGIGVGSPEFKVWEASNCGQ